MHSGGARPEVQTAWRSEKVSSLTWWPRLYHAKLGCRPLARFYKLPTIYDRRNSALEGGLIAFGPSFVDSYYRAGILVGRVLKGEKPADLPVELPTKFELVVNLKTAKSLGLQVPQSILARADEVIE
jgi:putative ABC transport system substrate-binding protein